MERTHSLRDLQVVLVEPSHMQVNLISQMLRALHVERIDVCSQAAEALERMSANPPSLVMSSLYLPDLSGTELVLSMRKREALERVPFILISSETRPQVLDPVRQSGACSILPKPFNEAQLYRALVGAVDYLSPNATLDVLRTEELRILLVDDSGVTRRHIRRMLEEQGVRDIVEAHNGQEAATLLAETLVDLVITDYNMPEMDGRALTEYIRQQSWQSSVPILMVTSEHNEGRLAAVQQAGVSAIYDKPFGPDSVRKVLADVLAG